MQLPELLKLTYKIAFFSFLHFHVKRNEAQINITHGGGGAGGGLHGNMDRSTHCPRTHSDPFKVTDEMGIYNAR